MKQTLYWVCWYKHGDLQAIASGPYFDWDAAEAARLLLDDPGRYRVGESTTEIELSQ